MIVAGLAGFRQAPGIGPNGDGTLLRSDDQSWLLLQAAAVFADTRKGEYRARFSPALRGLDERPFRLSGYMLPVETGISERHFIITRRSTGCPFCAPPGLTEAVEVFLRAPVNYTIEPITIEGRFRLVASSDVGLFYRIEDATAT